MHTAEPLLVSCSGKKIVILAQSGRNNRKTETNLCQRICISFSLKSCEKVIAREEGWVSHEVPLARKNKELECETQIPTLMGALNYNASKLFQNYIFKGWLWDGPVCESSDFIRSSPLIALPTDQARQKVTSFSSEEQSISVTCSEELNQVACQAGVEPSTVLSGSLFGVYPPIFFTV